MMPPEARSLAEAGQDLRNALRVLTADLRLSLLDLILAVIRQVLLLRNSPATRAAAFKAREACDFWERERDLRQRAYEARA